MEFKLTRVENIGAKLPDVVYADNVVIMKHLESGFTYYLNGLDGLKFINYETREKHFQKPEVKTSHDLNNIDYIPPNVEVSVSKHWKNKTVPDDVEIDTTYKITSDWTYTTPYKGTIVPNPDDLEARLISYKLPDFNADKKYTITKTEEPLPRDKLTQTNPILTYHDIFMYESDLDDFGMAQYRVRFRAMKDCAFALCRFYLRSDDTIVRVVDTRVYIEYGTGVVWRDFSVRENTYEELKG